MLESKAKRVREQKVREAKGLYEKLRDYINHSYPDVIETAAESASDDRIDGIYDRLERALHVLLDSGLSPTKNRTKHDKYVM